MKIFRIIMLFAMMGSFLCSCEYEWIQPEKVEIPETLSFSSDIMPVFNKGCNINVCHGAGATPPDLTLANAYTSLFEGGYIDTLTPEASILYTSMKSGSMKQYTDPGDEQIILAWIKQGAKNN